MIDRLAFLREGWEDKDMEVAIDAALVSDYMTGDAAVYIYMDNGKVRWRTFSFKDGDVLFPHYDTLTGDMTLFGRQYQQTDWDGNTKTYLDVVDNTSFVTYVQKEDDMGWQMEGSPIKHGFPFCPVAYHRSEYGPVWSASQSLIDGYEVAISQFSENNAAYALRILYTLGAEMEVLTMATATAHQGDLHPPRKKSALPARVRRAMRQPRAMTTPR